MKRSELLNAPLLRDCGANIGVGWVRIKCEDGYLVGRLEPGGVRPDCYDFEQKHPPKDQWLCQVEADKDIAIATETGEFQAAHDYLNYDTDVAYCSKECAMLDGGRNIHPIYRQHMIEGAWEYGGKCPKCGRTLSTTKHKPIVTTADDLAAWKKGDVL